MEKSRRKDVESQLDHILLQISQLTTEITSLRQEKDKLKKALNKTNSKLNSICLHKDLQHVMNSDINFEKFVKFIEGKIKASDDKVLNKKDIITYLKAYRSIMETTESLIEESSPVPGCTISITPAVVNKDEENSSIQSVTEPIVVNSKSTEHSNISSPVEFNERRKARKQKRQLSADDYSAYAYITRLHPDWFMKASNNLSPFKHISLEKIKDKFKIPQIILEIL